MEITSKPCSPGEALELGQPRHPRLVGIDDLAQDGRGIQVGGPRQVDGRLGVACTLEHPAGSVAQRQDVAGTGQVPRPGARVDQGLDRGRPVRCRYAGGRPVAVVDGDGEGGALRLGVRGHHQRQVQLVEAVARHRHADETRGVSQEEGDLLGCHRLGGHDEVALVLPVLVVDRHDHVAATDGGDGVVDTGHRHVRDLPRASDPLAGRSAGARCTWRSRRPRGSPVHPAPCGPGW